MLNFSKRFYKSVYRYPYVGDNKSFKPQKALVITGSLVFIATYLIYKQVSKTRKSRELFSSNYKEVDPEMLVPKLEKMKKIDEVKLKEAILDGDKFIRDEIRKKIAITPGEYAFLHLKGVKDKTGFMKFVDRAVISSMKAQGNDIFEYKRPPINKNLNIMNKKSSST
ncbi:unnamed protein product [Blepharisma stoltei]|uniref:Uncharacterized protein n=1 Tax=Blepharisma stoltei TaxID=1481888 RepID=A0AAU9JFW8_9CILI|nr:unnamed protein product [Blepharisma stoltei]